MIDSLSVLTEDNLSDYEESEHEYEGEPVGGGEGDIISKFPDGDVWIEHTPQPTPTTDSVADLPNILSAPMKPKHTSIFNLSFLKRRKNAKYEDSY